MNSTMQNDRSDLQQALRSEHLTDEDLLLDYRTTQRRESFETLVQRYETELYNYLRHYTGDAQVAEDAFQATFLQVHLKCDQFQEGRKLRPWLYAVATNQAIDAQRRNRRHQMVSLDRRVRQPSEGDGGGLIDLLDSSDPAPVDTVSHAEQRETVAEAVDRLPDTLRQVVLLIYFQGLKYREAADVLDIPVGTVKSRLHTAIAKLNESLRDLETEWSAVA